jgi:tRNA threonylcarbamoyladenosine biosynthesis protein TsaB
LTYILSIETATEVCSVGLARDGVTETIRESRVPNVHSAFTAKFIIETLQEAGISMKQLSAVAVSKGPGSYTGLRIGVSSAKGVCFALDLPLISVCTLQAMALAASGGMGSHGDFYCPMIDARRMEVYDALYDAENREVREIRAEIIDGSSFREYPESQQIFFFGNGAAKCRENLQTRTNMTFLPDIFPSARFVGQIAYRKFREGLFEDVAYFEPFYLKDFIAKIPVVRGLK